MKPPADVRLKIEALPAGNIELRIESPAGEFRFPMNTRSARKLVTLIERAIEAHPAPIR